MVTVVAPRCWDSGIWTSFRSACGPKVSCHNCPTVLPWMQTAYAVLHLHARSSQFPFLHFRYLSWRTKKGSPLITDTLLESIAPLLSNLDHFHIAGCPELETRGVWALLSTNKRGLLSLGLEELSTRFVIHLQLFFFSAIFLTSTYRTSKPWAFYPRLTLHTPSGAFDLSHLTFRLPRCLVLQQRLFFLKPSQISLDPVLLKDSKYTVRRFWILFSSLFRRWSFCCAT